MKMYLLPRQDFNYSIRDLRISLLGLFQSDSCTEQISELFGAKEIYFMNHARTGLRLLLNSLGLTPNSRIGVQILNCHTVFNAIVKAGYKPVFIDINDNLTLSLDDLKKKLDQIDALIVTHLFGIPAEIEKIQTIIENKPVIEDCAHAFLSERNGKLMGTFGDAAIFSFGKGKFPSVGKGGFVIINNISMVPKFKEHYSTLKKNNFLSEIKNIAESLVLNVMHNVVVYRFVTFPFIKRLYNGLELNRKFESAEKKALKSNLTLFLKKFSLYESFKENQVQNSGILREYLKLYINSYIQETDIKSKPNFFMLPVITPNKYELINLLFKMGIEAGPHFYKSLEWAKELGYNQNDCKNAERLIPDLVVIPTYKPLTNNRLFQI